MKHLDLFSGIGGFALAGLSVWGKDYECVGFCDIEKYAQELLKIRFPGVKIYEDIKKLSADTDNRRQEKQEQQTTGNKQCDRQIDIITGGFPCQPFSMAGKRGGTKDDRYLWPEMLRVIKEFKPRWVIGENVFGLLSMAVNESEPKLEDDTDNGNEDNENVRANSVVWRIKQDLLNIGYDCEVLCIPACAVNAPHRRDRLWFIAHRAGKGLQRQICQQRKRKKNVQQKKQSRNRFSAWNENWIEVAAKLCGVDDGLSAELDGFKLSKSGHRVARIKGLGNAIVPQVAIELMKFIKKIDELNTPF
jgi:DNA (cytosine-5)-methyltransferase 1